MGSRTTKQDGSTEATRGGQTRPVDEQGARPRRMRSRPVKPGRLPVSEFAFDRAGAGSPFGDDLVLPLPVEHLRYVHPDQT
jgi:hypothetical protein